MRIVPALQQSGLRGGVIYHDGQFDDSRLLLNMVRTANDHGGCLLNYVAVTDLIKGEDDKVIGVKASDQESSAAFEIKSRCVINAAGPFCDAGATVR